MEQSLDVLLAEEGRPKPYRRIEGDLSLGLLIFCDHAENTLPEAYGTLGLRSEDLHRHIAYDLGAAGVTEHLASAFGAPALLTRFSRLLISASELDAMGLGDNKREQLAAKAERAARDFKSLAERQRSIGAEAKWVQFAATAPGLVPTGTDGSTQDVIVYENAVAMFEQGQQSGQLMVGTMIRVENAWRLVELPSVGEGETVAQTTGNFFTPGGNSMASAASAATISRETQQLVGELETIDNQLADAQKPSDVATLQKRRADIVEKLIGNSDNAMERDTWVRQLVDMLSVAAQTGAYPDATKRLTSVSRDFAAADPGLQSYADFQAISTEYVVRTADGLELCALTSTRSGRRRRFEQGERVWAAFSCFAVVLQAD